MANTKIVLNRQSDLILDNAQITNPEGIVIADISGLVSTVESIDAQESTNMSTEVVNRVAGDASIAANLSTELIERENAISTEASLRVVGDVSVTAAMSAEISSRIVAETSLANDIEAEASTGLVRDQAEASMARAAEQSVATDLIAEQSRAESAEASLNAKVENVISNVDPAALDSLTEIVGAFQSADGDLNGAITALGSTATVAVDAEASIRLSADESIAANLSSELVDRAAAVSTEEAARISGDVSVALDLSSEIQARISDVDAEQARAESAEASLKSEISITSDNIWEDVSTVNESRISGDASLEASIIEAHTARDNGDVSLETDLSAEISRAESAELSLSELLAEDLSTEASIRLAADESIAAELSDEIGALALTDETTIELNTADNTIRLKETVSAPDSGVRTFLGEVDVETVLRVNGADVIAEISTEASLRVEGDASLDVAVSAEASLRTAADVSIAASLSTELVDRAAAVSAEASLRTAGDLSLEVAVSAEQSRVDAILLASDADKDSFAEIVSLINSVDTTNDEVFAGYVLSNDAALSTEVSRAESAEASLEAAKLDLAGGTMTGTLDMGGNEITNIDVVQTNELVSPNGPNGVVQFTGILGMNDGIIAELGAPTSDGDAANKLYVDGEISAEVSRAESAELSLSNLLGADVSAEASIRLAADESLMTFTTAVRDDVWEGIESEISDRASADASLDSALSAEISRAEAAEASIAEELSSEVSYIIANTDLTSIDSFAEVVADMSSEVARAESAEASIALDFANIYAKHVAVNETPNGTLTAFTIATPVREGSELVYMNGLLLDAGDYIPNMVSGKVAGFTFINAPLANDKVNAYGVC